MPKADPPVAEKSVNIVRRIVEVGGEGKDERRRDDRTFLPDDA